LTQSNPGTVRVGGVPVGELFATFQDGDDLVEQLRMRMAYVGASFGVVDELSELGEGACAKYLSAGRARQFTLPSLLRVCSVLGLKALLVVDPELTQKWKPFWGNRDSAKVHARRPALGAQIMKRVRPAVLSELGRRGAAARNRKLAPEVRAQLARAAANARWQGRRT
jgi:hypothetical protein